MNNFQQLAIIGSTASGKSALAVKVAQKINANILSLDSLSIYKEIDIASAKPTIEERKGIVHFGVDIITPNEAFDVTTFIELYQEARYKSIQEERNLIIVGGTSFYLKTLIEGISPLPKISNTTQQKSNEYLQDLESAYRFLYSLDKSYMSRIKPEDRYRIEKMLNLYFETDMTPSNYFRTNPPKPIIDEKLDIYEINIERELLRRRIKKRTLTMIQMGLIDEVKMLEQRYTREPNCMKSIGIKEVLKYFDGEYTKEEMQEWITIHTAQLAKRQRTFNKSQFKSRVSLPLDELERSLL